MLAAHLSLLFVSRGEAGVQPQTPDGQPVAHLIHRKCSAGCKGNQSSSQIESEEAVEKIDIVYLYLILFCNIY